MQSVIEAYPHKEHRTLMETTTKLTLDVRPIPPAQKHLTIFQTFDDLKPGEAFELVNDHNPKPLHYQMMFERENEFTWDYLEEGPTVWRVRIGKRVADTA